MQKRLNPGLFEDSGPQQVTQPPSPSTPIPPSHMGAAGTLEAHKLFEDIQSIKTKMRTYDNQLEVFRKQMSEFVSSIDQRFERVSQAMSRLEKSVHNQGRDTEEKFRHVRDKIQSQGFEEAKVEGLIERQTVVIRNFENRLSALQKIINEKEVLLMRYLSETWIIPFFLFGASVRWLNLPSCSLMIFQE